MQTAPDLDRRVSTGPLKFGSEPWPGVFVRGDDAMCIEAMLRAYARTLEAGDLGRKTADRFADIFASCQV